MTYYKNYNPTGYDPECPTQADIADLFFNGLESEEDTNHFNGWINLLMTFQTSGKGQCYFCLPATLDALVQAYFNGLNTQEDITNYIRWTEGIQLYQTTDENERSIFYYPYLSFVNIKSHYDEKNNLDLNSSVSLPNQKHRTELNSIEDIMEKWLSFEEYLNFIYVKSDYDHNDILVSEKTIASPKKDHLTELRSLGLEEDSNEQ